ncbi:enoyl-CoA hydratase-related protein [Natrinema sp. 1APR25-10V2]|uniref:enoyl-CoA hydratase/isomerase family protein n=1 Tax=Natrinema sp. 1APR25-10V2 TaxID=2951081 RepID=UPI002875BA01|nr:enoyl-CoA hydratase-related protein [Natrinema sp. 1APR25-10V2]MDS0476997.1 enoyl-CoA hydratase-related protein [Natrinema sp. 1APR25-10V2]
MARSLPECENFVLERDDNVLSITIDSTTKFNSLNDTMGDELLELAAFLNVDDGTRCAVMTGSDGVFCAGADVEGFAEDGHRPDSVRRGASILHDAIVQFHQADVPLITGVNGVATGAGLGIALLGDIVLISEDARFEYAYPRLGLPGDGGATFHLPRFVGLRKAKDIALLDRPITPDEAVEWGLATESVPDDELDGRLDELAHELASGPTRAYGAAKQLLTRSFDRSLEEQLAAETDAIATAAETNDHAEGVAAFVEKREPEFEGH